MVRIIHPESNNIEEGPVELDQLHLDVLKAFGQMIVHDPEPIKQLLEDYSIPKEQTQTAELLREQFISALGDCDAEFNRELANVLMDSSINNDYDSFDIKAMAGKSGKAVGEIAAGVARGGIAGGVASTIGQIGSAVSSRNANKQAQRQAHTQAKKALTPAPPQETLKGDETESNTNKLAVIGLLIVLGIGTALVVSRLKNQKQQPIN